MPAVAPTTRAAFAGRHIAMLRFRNSNSASEGGLYVLHLHPPKQKQSEANLHRLNQRPEEAPRRTQRGQIDPHQQVQVLGPSRIRCAAGKGSGGTIRKIPKDRIRARLCQKALTIAERAEILMPDPPLLRKDGPPGLPPSRNRVFFRGHDIKPCGCLMKRVAYFLRQL